MYRWNSRVPTVRSKDTSLNDSISSGTISSTEDIITNSNTNSYDLCRSNYASSSNSCEGSGGNLSGSSLTSSTTANPLTSRVNHGSHPSIEEATTTSSSLFTTSTDSRELTTSSSSPHLHLLPPLSTPSAGAGTAESLFETRAATGGLIESEKLVEDKSKQWNNWNVIRGFFLSSRVAFVVVREIRTLSTALLVGLILNPINYFICSFSPSLALFSASIGSRTVPGGSSASYCCCKRRTRRNTILDTTRIRSSSRSCCCTCNCISFLRPTTIFAECCSSSRVIEGPSQHKDTRSSCCSNKPTAAPGKPRRLGKMAQILSKTMTLLGVAFVIHFIIMSTFAEKEGFTRPRFSLEESRKHHYHHHYYGEMEVGAGKRLARSYRHEKHPTPVPDNVVASLTGHHSRLMSNNNKSEAVFSTENSTVIIAQIGSKTYLPCAVRNLGSGVASWIRRRDYHLLTVGMGTYSNDDRFMVSHNRPAQSWELHIKFVKPSDEGLYECQISTHPPSSIFVHLRVVEAKAEILGEPDKHVRSGSTFELVCVLRDSTEPPVYVFWYHNDRMINYDNVRGVQVSSDAEKSILTIQEAQKSDSGNYSCVPSNARPTSISVHILNGEKPAAMQHGSRNHSSRLAPSGSPSLLFVTALVVSFLTTWLATTNLSVQNLFHFHHHQYDEHEAKKKGEQQQHHQQHRSFSNRTPPQRKLEKEKQQKEESYQENHSHHHHHHLYLLQLLKKIQELVGKKGNSLAAGDDNPAHRHSESTAFATTLCLFLLLQVNRRAVEYFCKSNLKKPHPKTSPATHSIPSSTSADRQRRRPADTILRERYSSESNVYDYCYPRQILSVGEEEAEEKETGGVHITSQDHHHRRKQSREHTSLVVYTDFEVKMMIIMFTTAVMMTMMMKKQEKGDGNSELTFSSADDCDSQNLIESFTQEFRDKKFPRRAGCRMCANVTEEQGEGEVGTKLVVVMIEVAAHQLTTKVASGVTVQSVGGGGGGGRMRSTSVSAITSPQFSFSSVVSPFPSSIPPCVTTTTTTTTTFPQAYKRFITANSVITQRNLVESLSSPHSSIEEMLGLNVLLLVAEGFSIVVPPPFGEVVIIEKREGTSLHHHFFVLFPSAYSYYYSLTTSGLLSSTSHPQLLSSSLVVVAPTRKTTSSMNTTTSTTTTTTTTSFQPLFCSRNKAEEEDCLPRLFVKTLLPSFSPSPTPRAVVVEEEGEAVNFSLNVPNAYTNTIVVVSPPDCSFIPMTQVMAVR